MRLREHLLRSWQQANALSWLLWPFSLLYGVLIALRRLAYQSGLLQVYRAPVPVIVIGNLSVGGTGKTPLVIHLVEQLRRLGYRPGVVSHGYGGHAAAYPLPVNRQTPPGECGDEPALVVSRTGVAMVVGPNRQADVELLLENPAVDIIISDDGLQHLALQRDIEICLVDETTPQENRFLLPAGPFREPIKRLASVDIVVRHVTPDKYGDQPFSMTLRPRPPVALSTLAEPLPFDASKGLHAVAGIGNPQRFFNTCIDLGWSIEQHPFADHHNFSAADLELAGDKPILMTEKDAVKCRQFANNRLWYLPVDVQLSEDFNEKLANLISLKCTERPVGSNNVGAHRG